MPKTAGSPAWPLTAETTPLELDGGLAELRGDCARMVPHWRAGVPAAAEPVPASRLHGIVVPPASARLLDGMSEYGD
ncbi:MULTISPECIES: hypothetical protein [Streptomyces]|uniref:Uncharacterized protein n=1 Tax=Streptomyces lycii TaxID=2654337 RepID=A0ABQ7FBW2_9ACTN|nr:MULTISPECIES: hypothetical protein [Streptomyces]KAF4406466.1 hypothetical protein GCU69_24715 [Streptomyces lycii]PGH50749.1 hypothetical protein CRI70_10440 [Streptomyces sp. Ru87]